MYSVFLNQLWNNGDCAVDSLVYSNGLNNYIGGRQHIMSKPMMDVDMMCILFYFTNTVKYVFLLYVFQFHMIHDIFTRIFYI